MARVQVDTEALGNWLSKQPESKKEIAERIGRSRTYFDTVLRSGTAYDAPLRLLCTTYSLPEDSFLVQPEEPEEKSAEHSGYWTDLQVFPDKVLLTLWFTSNGEDLEVGHAYSRIKGTRELDLVQSISYAAHMIYKMVEQRQLGK